MNPDPSPQRLVGRERRQGMRKGRQACDSCRAGKRKCDGARPVCGTCTRRGPRGSCEYGKSGGRTSRTSKQIELLEQRIAELEGDRFRTPGAESDGDPPPHTQPRVSSQRAAEPPALEHTSAGDFSYGRPTTDAPLPASSSPQPSDMGLPGDLPFVQDPPGAGASPKGDEVIHHERPRPASRLEEEPKIVGGRVDGMGTAAGNGLSMSGLCAEQIGYFGMSSTVNFVNQVHRILIDSNDPHHSSSSACNQEESGRVARRAQQTSHTQQNREPPQYSLEEYVVPPRKDADAMLEVFWLRIYPLYPILDRERFERDYAEIWTSDHSPSSMPPRPASACSPDYRYQYPNHVGPGDKIPKSRRFHILLNIMFALGRQCDSSEPSARQAQRGDIFWKRSKDLLELDFDIFNQPCIEFIVAFFFMSVYLQSTTELTGACWNFAGLSIRFAQALGLHCNSYPVIVNLATMAECPPKGVATTHFAGGYGPHLTLATTYGRPLMISSRAARARLPSELARQASASSPSSSPSSTSLNFLIHLLDLQEILADVVAHYNDDDSVTADESGDALPHYRYGGEEPNMMFKAPSLIRQIEEGDFQDLANFEANLLDWERELPPSLRLPHIMELTANPYLAASVERQSVVLRARYLYGQVLIFRPLLLYRMAQAKYRRDNRSDSSTIILTLGNALLDRGQSMCINAAVDLVLLLDWLNRTRDDAMPEPWFTIF
ncbi:unnamed protein product, partial [Clonostachys rosea f. rosea IK726]